MNIYLRIRPEMEDGLRTNLTLNVYWKNVKQFVEDTLSPLRERIEAEEAATSEKTRIFIVVKEDISGFYLGYLNYSTELADEMDILWGQADSQRFNSELSTYLDSLDN